MRQLSILVLGMVSAAAFLTVKPLPAVAQDANLGEELKGKAITVITKSNPRFSAELEKVQVKAVHGKPFLVGVGADTPNNWQKGLPVWVALDDISMMTVFDSIEAMRRHITQPDAQRGQRNGK